MADAFTVVADRLEAKSPEPLGAKLLGDVYRFLGRFVAYPSDDCRIAHTLWIAHTHLMDAWESTPRLAFLSPEPASGKTRALEITETLVPRPVEAVNATPAYLFRKVSDPEGPPTILFDEIDTVFGRGRENEEVRGVLNAGHRRGAMAGRCVVKGKIIETEELPAYCAVAVAGLGRLPDTVLSRSVVVRMRRRKATERVEPYRRRIHAPQGHKLRDQLELWAETIFDDMCEATPEMPPGVEDRNADMWEPLLAVADAAGGHWPETARVSSVSLVSLAQERTPSLGIKLLEDIKAVFDELEVDRITTVDLLEKLNGMEESPWGDLKGKPLDSRRLSRMLGEYEISPGQVRVSDEKTLKGYLKEHFLDTWPRYVNPEDASPTAETSETSVTCPRCDGEGCGWCETSNKEATQ